MYLLTLNSRKDDGAYAVQDSDGDKVLFLFEEEDDAVRYAMMLEDNLEQEKNMQVIEVEDDLAIKTCSMYNYKYAVVTPDDLVIPPSNDKVQED
jgi:hypothetical protein|tara:strand:- start:726 stop:1007 length:282 start_codon:yes stop_codon:yes gene_type:complete